MVAGRVCPMVLGVRKRGEGRGVSRTRREFLKGRDSQVVMRLYACGGRW